MLEKGDCWDPFRVTQFLDSNCEHLRFHMYYVFLALLILVKTLRSRYYYINKDTK